MNTNGLLYQIDGKLVMVRLLESPGWLRAEMLEGTIPEDYFPGMAPEASAQMAHRIQELMTGCMFKALVFKPSFEEMSFESPLEETIWKSICCFLKKRGWKPFQFTQIRQISVFSLNGKGLT